MTFVLRVPSEEFVRAVLDELCGSSPHLAYGELISTPFSDLGLGTLDRVEFVERLATACGVECASYVVQLAVPHKTPLSVVHQVVSLSMQ